MAARQAVVAGDRRRGVSRLLGLAMFGLGLGCGGAGADPGPDAGPADAGAPDPCAPEDPAPAKALACPEPRSVECQGPRTPVTLEDLGMPGLVDDACGLDAVASLLDDLPPDGLPVGSHRVEVRAATRRGAVLACTTRVDVIDPRLPEVTCPAPETLVRTRPDEVMAPPPLADASDACDPGVVGARPTTAALPTGTSSVRYEVADAQGLVGGCEVEMTVLEAFPARRFRVLGGRLRGDGRTDVYLAWDGVDGADVTAFAVERGAAPGGPFEVVDVVDADRRTFVDRGVPGPRAHYRLVSRAGPNRLPGGATETVTAHAIRGQTYDLRDRGVPTLSFDTTLYGVTRHPVALDDGAHPLVLLMHGNHGICRRTITDDVDYCTLSVDHDCGVDGFVTTPNAEGLAWLAESLAVQGRVAVTVSANAMNCRRDFNRERSQLLVAHLRQWKTWAEGSAAPFGGRFVGKVDLDRVGIFGHSRGGEAVALVPEVLSATPIEGLTLRSVFSLAPVDFHDPMPSGVPYAVLLPTCDGDVWTLVGMEVYDRTFGDGGGAPVVQLTLDGANHNFFNTEWRLDDNRGGGSGRTCPTPTGVDGPAQRALLEGAVGAWMAATVDPPTAPGRLAAWLRADAPVPESLDTWAGIDLDVRRAYGAAARLVVDDVEAAGAPDDNALGQANTFDGFVDATVCAPGGCGSAYRHARRTVSVRWDEDDATAAFGLGGLDVGAWGLVAFRVASRADPLNEGRTSQDARVRLRDAAGREAVLRLSRAEPVPHLYGAFSPFEILQSVRLPLSDFKAVEPLLDLSALDAIELVLAPEEEGPGALLVGDVTFAASP